LESSCGQRFRSKESSTWPVEPAGPQPLGKGWPVRLSAGSASACSAATDVRSGQPARTPTPAGTAADHADIVRFRERMPTVERARTVALARPAAVASDREPRASSTARSELGFAAVGRSHPGGRRSVIGLEHSPARGRGGALAPSPPSSFGREHGRRVRRRASPVQPGLGRFAAAGGSRATPGPLATAGPRAWAVATFARALERAKVAVLSPGVGASTPDRGPFRTVNWTLNAESRPQRERRAARLRAQKPSISRQNPKWRGPESNRGHHDFQSCALPTELPRRVVGADGSGANTP
jgi:hypothetical protein